MDGRCGFTGRAGAAVIALALLLGSSMAWAADARSFTLRLEAGRIFLTARDALLGDVLGEIGHRGGFEIRLDGRLESRVDTEVVTTTVQDEALETALQRLLGVENIVFLYAQAGLVEVRAYADRPGGSLSAGVKRGRGGVADADRINVARLQREALGNPDPEARADALDDVAAQGDEAVARDTALEVLRHDADERVLTRALTVLSELERVPLDPLMKFATTNREAYLRVQALEILGEHGKKDARVNALLLTLSTRDPDEEVRESAKTLLEDLSDE